MPRLQPKKLVEAHIGTRLVHRAHAAEEK